MITTAELMNSNTKIPADSATHTIGQHRHTSHVQQQFLS